MRITSAIRSLALVSLFCISAPLLVSAQDQPAPDAQTNFGPRKKPAGQAQQAAKKAPTTETVATHGAWTVQCGIVQEGQEAAGRQCGMAQVSKSEKNDKVGISLVIAKSKQGEKVLTMMRIIAPIGVYLPTGVALEIDGAAVGRVPFTRCRPTVCEALAEASGPTMAKLKQGGGANFIIYEAPGIGIPLKISLDGFSAALAELDKQK